MSTLASINSGAVRGVVGSFCASRIALAINAGAAATVKSTGAIIYAIGGVFYTRAALAAQALTITHRFDGSPVTVADPAYTQPAGTTAIYLLSVNAAGTLAVSQGTYAGQRVAYANDLAKVATGNGGIPTEPNGYTAIGAIKIATAGAATFVPATTALDATDVTATYYNLAVVPDSL